MNTTLNTATVAYYNGTTAGSMACFVCNNGGGYELTATERICQSNSTWSGSPITCGMSVYIIHILQSPSGPTQVVARVDRDLTLLIILAKFYSRSGHALSDS